MDRRTESARRARPRVAAWTTLAACALLAALAGCAPTRVPAEDGREVRDIGISSFSDPAAGKGIEVVATPMPDVEPPSTREVTETDVLADGTAIVRRSEEVTALNPATQRVETEVIDQGSTPALRVGQRWPVESLVGQINGRPIFAEEVFRQIEAAVLLAAQDPNPDTARAQVDMLVRRAFRQQVESELILAEAESRLSPEMKQGLLGWLRDMQESAIAQRGGSRAAAEESLRDELQMSVEEFVEFQTNRELTRDILRRKVEPRVVVSWRDVERLYSQRRQAYAPDPEYRLGRIRLLKDVQADKIDLAKRMFAEGKSFLEVAAAVAAPDGGFWRSVAAQDGQMRVDDLADDLQAVLRPLRPGEVSAAYEQRSSVQWFAVLGVETPPSVSIFDPELQLSLRGELQATQERLEQGRYIQSLQKRWLGASIQKMELRLVQMARERYLDPLKQLRGPASR
ncbi:MAG: hypothetical protein ACKOF7_12650, partial [Phycisphaerales bacterium]